MRPLGHRLLVTATVASSFLLGACPAARAEEEVRASGTGTGLGALRRLAGPFARANPGHGLTVLPSVGSSGAVQAVASGALEVAISGRPLRASERSLGLVSFAYARTPFVFAVGPRVDVTTITPQEIVRIYRGEMTTWPNGERVRVVLRPRTDVDDDILRALTPEMPAALDAAHARDGMILALTNQECDDLLSRTPGAIGPSTLTQALTDEAQLVPLRWNGVAPTVANLVSGAYPLAKTLFVVVRDPPPPPVRRLLAFLASAEGRKILEETGNLPLPMKPDPPDDQRR